MRQELLLTVKNATVCECNSGLGMQKISCYIQFEARKKFRLS